MGTCWSCGTQVTLKDDETNCPNCGEILWYRCNSCKRPFEIVDKETKKKLTECKFCGKFFCPHCGDCSWNCERYTWEKDLLKIFLPEINQTVYPKILDKIREIINYFEDVKITNERRNCPERNVPITYAKNRIKSLLAKFEGFRVKDKDDREAFLKKLDVITEKPIGTKLTVTESREKGSYGQEYRDAFNLAVCMGKFKIIRKKKINSDEEYDLFERCEIPPCKYLAKDDLIITYCPNCKKTYPRGTKLCDKCPRKKVGKHKGELWELKEKLTTKDICQVYRGDFNKKNG